MARPSDACPYPKPFGPDFNECPAFQPRPFIPLDTLYQPLAPVITCRHLVTRALPQGHRWYAACAIGEEAARQRWAGELGADRLARMRTLQRELGGALAPFSVRMWELKGKQLRALRDGQDASPITAELHELAGQVMTAVSAFAQSNQEAFLQVDLPVAAAKQLISAAIDDFLESRFAAEISLEVPDQVLEQFPPSARAFFRPTAGDRSGTPT